MYLFPTAFIASAVFTILCLRGGPPGKQRFEGPAIFAAAAALLIAAAVLACLLIPLRAGGDSRIAWTGVESAHSDLVIGDSGTPQSLAWPNGAFAPVVRIACSSESDCDLDMSAGGGFVVQNGEVLNGARIESGRVIEVDGFRVSLLSRFFGRPRLRLEAQGMQPMESSDLGREYRAESMQTLFGGTMATLRRDRWTKDQTALAKAAMDLERWATPLRVMPVGKQAWILTTDTYHAKIMLPAALEIIWPNRVLHTLLARSASGSVALRFRRPWQRLSPIPGRELVNAGPLKLTVTTEPAPGEIAFLLPLRSDTVLRKLVEMQGGLLVGEGQEEIKKKRVEAAVPEDLLTGPRRPVAALIAEPSLATSTADVSVGGESAIIQTVRVQPRYWVLIFGVVAAWFAFAFALDVTLRQPNRARYQQIQGIRLEDRRMLAALSIVIWTFLLLRLALALRYAQDPGYLDQVVVEGVTWALFGLAVVPGFVLRAAMMWLPQVQDANADDARRIRWMTALLLLIGAGEVALAEYGFWPALPNDVRRVSSVIGWAVLLLILLIVFLWTCIRVNHEYFWESRPQSEIASERRLEKRLHEFVLQVSTRYAAFARDLDAPLWQNLYAEHIANKSFWSLYGLLAISILIIIAVYAMLYAAAQRIFPGSEVLKEVFAPLLLSLPPICFLLNSRIAFPAGSVLGPRAPKPEWGRAITVTAALIILLAIVYPIALRDPGAFVATLALFVPTSLILIAGGPPWRIPWLAFGCLAIGFLIAAMVFLEFRPAMEVAGHFGEMKLRVMEFRHPDQVEQAILFGGVAHPESFRFEPPLRAVRMRQTHQHLWEMQAMAHLGGYRGVGFSQAPVRKSQVRQDTLQYDSTFSFFVLSEHGLLGGCALLCLYALPLAIVLFSARRKLDVGHALAIVIASAFFLEAISHALMNVGALPETGRSMPFLAVKSISDLLRWAILFRVLAQALLWRVTAAESGNSRDPALLPEPASTRRPLVRRYFITCAAFAGGAVLLIAWLAMADIGAIQDRRLIELTWDDLLAATNAHIREKHFVLRNGRVEPSPDIRRSGDLLFLQEMARFNQLTDAEKITGLPREDAQRFCEAARGVHTLADYDRLMNLLRVADRPRAGELRPSLFLLRRDEEEGGEDVDAADIAQPSPARSHGDPCTLPPDHDLKLRANPAFVSRTRFDAPLRHVPSVYMAGAQQAVIGPAWVEGRWVTAVDKSAPIPWIGYLRSGLTGGYQHPQLDASGNVILTLNANLQSAAQQFVALHARQRHEQLLTEHKPVTPGDVEPPRAAIAIVNLKHGEVVALGGYPRMTAAPVWESEAAAGGSGREWFPPAEWIERRSPNSIRSRYDSDRNFERLLMGSSTKPIWAAAAVALHPSLDHKLGVSGPAGSESEIFGIPVRGGPWEIDAPSVGLKGGWCDFTSYLARSDNRYQVRLGFLSLAEWDGENPRQGSRRSEDPGDARETISLSSVWRQYPMFPPLIRFSPGTPDVLTNVQRQPIADRLRAMFGVETSDSDTASVRSSFWTGNEEDDGKLAPLGSSMREISPQRVNMAFDRVTVPRDFVTLLLGGRDNRWSNVDFAGAFASAVLGYALVPHIVRLPQPAVSQRQPFHDVSTKLRPGLAAALANPQGTVWQQLGTARSVKDFFSRHPQYKIYAKTGTLPSAKGKPNTSRLVLAMVEWKPGEKEAKSGLVFSMVIDRGNTGMAANWLGQFIDQNQSGILRVLQQ